MHRNTKIQMAAVLAVGTVLGYLAASGRPGHYSRADVAPSTVGAAGVKPAEPGGGAKAACCEDVTKGQLLALADPKAEASAQGQANGKKPNIVFIMGDDVGWFQIGAYHRGIMSGKTPNLDKLASQGMVFTD